MSKGPLYFVSIETYKSFLNFCGIDKSNTGNPIEFKGLSNYNIGVRNIQVRNTGDYSRDVVFQLIAYKDCNKKTSDGLIRNNLGYIQGFYNKGGFINRITKSGIFNVYRTYAGTLYIAYYRHEILHTIISFFSDRYYF